MELLPSYESAEKITANAKGARSTQQRNCNRIDAIVELRQKELGHNFVTTRFDFVGEIPMASTIDLLPSAADLKKRMAEVEAEKASEYLRKQAATDAEKKALLDQFLKPSGVSEEERLKRASAIINRAVNNGLTEVLVGKFPNQLFTDHGRAINQQEAGWEQTLTGLPKELYEFWKKYLQPRGYRLKFQIVDWPGGMPGDVGITLSWG